MSQRSPVEVGNTLHEIASAAVLSGMPPMTPATPIVHAAGLEEGAVCRGPGQ